MTKIKSSQLSFLLTLLVPFFIQAQEIEINKIYVTVVKSCFNNQNAKALPIVNPNKLSVCKDSVCAETESIPLAFTALGPNRTLLYKLKDGNPHSLIGETDTAHIEKLLQDCLKSKTATVTADIVIKPLEQLSMHFQQSSCGIFNWNLDYQIKSTYKFQLGSLILSAREITKETYSTKTECELIRQSY
jgi:hypothetical protein